MEVYDGEAPGRPLQSRSVVRGAHVLELNLHGLRCGGYELGPGGHDTCGVVGRDEHEQPGDGALHGLADSAGGRRADEQTDDAGDPSCPAEGGEEGREVGELEGHGSPYGLGAPRIDRQVAAPTTPSTL